MPGIRGSENGAATAASYDAAPETQVSATDSREPGRARSACECYRCFWVIICLLIFIGTGISIIWYGPSKLLRNLLLKLPKEPGWGWYGGLGFMTMISIVTLMPIWPPLCMASGLIFGIRYGMMLNFFAITGAALLSICLGRCCLREPIRTWLEEGDFPTTRRMLLVLEDEEYSLKFQVLFRFLFIPMFVRNYVPSTLDIPIWKLAVGSIPHSLWISLLFASIGATFKDTAELIRDGKEVSFRDMKWQQALILVVSLVVAIVLAVYAQRKYMERVAQEEGSSLTAGNDHTSSSKNGSQASPAPPGQELLNQASHPGV